MATEMDALSLALHQKDDAMRLIMTNLARAGGTRTCMAFLVHVIVESEALFRHNMMMNGATGAEADKAIAELRDLGRPEAEKWLAQATHMHSFTKMGEQITEVGHG